MSLRRALIGSVLLVIVLTTVLMGVLGTFSISINVRREAQQRVNDDLSTLWIRYQEDVERLLRRAERAAAGLQLNSDRLSDDVAIIREDLGLTVLNLCNAAGGVLAGTVADSTLPAPIDSDPVLRRALEGEKHWGTVQLDWDRLAWEIGPEQAGDLKVPLREPTAERSISPAFFEWLAIPIKDEQGDVIALLYGGWALNHNFDYVDGLRDLVFGTSEYRDKPVATVTIFADGVRVATNVLDAEGQQALGTVVSDVVHEHVLHDGRVWTDRAWVVDAWYVSAYRPLRDPDGNIVGMLYAGLLDAPYVALRNKLLTRFALILAGSALVGVFVATMVVRRITEPLETLTDAARAFMEGDSSQEPQPKASFSEINTLQRTFAEARLGILRRDRKLSRQNQTLRDTNSELERVNSNYMQTLRFVTHELKAPLAAIQSMINLMLDGYLGEVPEKIDSYLHRVNHNCEDLQDMVKNYLDLSRVERGELTTNPDDVDCLINIVEPCVDQLQALFRSRKMELEVECPESIGMHVDAGLIRIALTNYLSNAAKYGREGGLARVRVGATDDQVEMEVWNQGPGFAAAEMESLFKQFSRLKNENTRSKKGSGVGLFLCRHIVELHGGQVRAASESGEWASFTLSIPRRPQPDPAPTPASA